MKTAATIILMFCFTVFCGRVYGQINLKNITKNKINNRAQQRTGQAIDKGLNEIEGVFKNKNSTPDNNKETKNDKKVTNNETVQSKPNAPSLQSYSKFDFIPGEKVIFFEDFSNTEIGDFPSMWNTNGSGEVVTTNLFPGKWLKFVGDKSIWTDDLLQLPENYTIEFDIIPIKGEDKSMRGYGFRLMQTLNAKSFDYGSVPGKAGFAFVVEYFGRPNYRTYMNDKEGQNLGLSGSNEDLDNKQKENQLYHISIWAQKSRIRLYQNETKLFDLPKAFALSSVKMDRIRFENGAAMVSNIKIAVGAPDMRSKLITEGKLVSYGIYFDVNKDQVKPESYGTLKTIATVLNENSDVRIKIIGHTDSDGADTDNLDLSKRRSASVKDELVKTFGINASRIESDGMGEGSPVAPNDKPVNKALNRRVEFVKL